LRILPPKFFALQVPNKPFMNVAGSRIMAFIQKAQQSFYADTPTGNAVVVKKVQRLGPAIDPPDD
jgi:hypothetical protein